MNYFSGSLTLIKFYLLNLAKVVMKKNKEKESIFFDLSPIDNADQNGIYSRALNEAMKNVNVHNIALTGPYGSGKTSVIKTFEKNSKYKFLNISLATFANPKGKEREPCDISDEQNIFIERSILQQMLYGSDSESLQYSRFKKISIPKRVELKSLIFTSWLLLCLFAYSNRDSLMLSIDYSRPTWILIFTLLFMFSTLAYILSLIYKATHSFSIKKLSLNNGEVEIGDISEDSVLNRHLDEIIYFFDNTKYDLVVIEDLDRFGSPEIFIKLREINKILNDRRVKNPKFWKVNSRKQPIKFLYAIKDDMFDNKSRAKFFDFIVPVVPIINSSNSKEKIIARLREANYEHLVNSSFIREVSLYIDDMRLINNIINEFVIYDSKIGSDSLNRIKLLAIVIYKNIYPNDFERLHHGKGALHSVCELRLSLIKNRKRDIEEEITSIRTALSASQDEVATNIEELIKIFLVNLHAHDKTRVLKGVYIDGNVITIDDLLQWDKFSQLISQTNISLAYPHPHNFHHNQSVNLGKSFLKIQEEISPRMSFQNRKILVENKSKNKIKDFTDRLNKLTIENSAISKAALSELINRPNCQLEEVLASNGITNPDLLMYLLRNGYLDETYFLYVSNFHEGSISKRDRDFLLAIRDFKIPDPAQSIDTPSEVCNEMRSEDFEHEYVLNVNLIDYLLTTDGQHHKKTISAVRFISRNFSKSSNFFSAYWLTGKNLADLTNAISENWPSYASAAIKSDNAAEHVAAILAYVNPDYIEDEMNENEVLSNYISKNSGVVFSVGHVSHSNYMAIKKLRIKISKLSELLAYSDLFEFIHCNDLYEINIENVLLILKKFPRLEHASLLNLEHANYTSIRDFGSNELNHYISNNLPLYIDSVFLGLPDNFEESGRYIKEMLNNDTLNKDQKELIVNKQKFIFPSFSGVPQILWESILLSNRIEVSWFNIMQCFNCNDCDRGAITTVLNSDYFVDILSNEKISIADFGVDSSLELSRFIFKNEEISDINYKKLCRVLSHNFNNFPEGISAKKCISLVYAGAVKLNENSFNFSENNKYIRSSLIANNLQEYENNKSKYQICDEIKEILVFSDINQLYKKKFAADISAVSVEKSRKLTNFISDLIVLPNANIKEWDKNVISNCIVNFEQLKISILILSKAIGFLDKDELMGILSRMPEPYSEIAVSGKRPKLPGTEENTELANQLKNQGFISSIKHEAEGIRIITFQS